ncbi:hypothetical protein [Peribacillus alkalitolerans]|nr:hypothetical protein [Peribacillus alkalitolerans]
MYKENNPLFSDEFLDDLASEINKLYGGLSQENKIVIENDEKE